MADARDRQDRTPEERLLAETQAAIQARVDEAIRCACEAKK